MLNSDLHYRTTKKSLVACMLAFSLFFSTGVVYASLQKSLWPKWEINNPLSNKVISHKLWNDFLKKYVITNEEGINLVGYASMSHYDLTLLGKYIQDMSMLDIDNYNRQEQLAYWINVYNALTVQTVANYYPVSDIQEISITPGLFSNGPWGGVLIHVNNTPLSLDDINNRIIRPIWNDSRALYALNDATIGSPNLTNAAYQGSIIEQQLNKAASDYINSLRGVEVIEGKLFTSKMYDWYEEDFGGTKQSVIKHLVQFAKEPLKSQLKRIDTIDSYIYNWHINSPAENSAVIKTRD
jgi:hypothetical protein